MAFRFSVDGQIYDIVEATQSGHIIHKQRVTFAYARDLDAFVDKLLEQNNAKTDELQRFLSLANNEPPREPLIERLDKGSYIIQKGSLAHIGGVGRAPTATAAQQAQDQRKSALYSNAMLSQMASINGDDDSTGSSGVSTGSTGGYGGASGSGASAGGGFGASGAGSPSVSSSDSPVPENKPKDLNYEVTIEIAGQHLTKTQSLVLTTAAGEVIKKYPNNDHKSGHRSICRFSNLEQAPCKLSLAIPMKGQSQPMMLPLLDSINPVAKGVQKETWDTLIVPVKPLQFTTANNEKNQSDILQQGWLYIFWQGQLWRELAVSKKGTLQDVDIAFYRDSKTDKREASGHWLDAVWVPYQVDGTEQPDIKLVASPIQWTWSTISEFENNPGKFEDQSASLDALRGYTGGKQFDDSPTQSGSITNAKLAVESSDRQLARQRRQKISAVYLPKTSSKLKIYLKDDLGNILSNVNFSLEVNGQQITARTDSQGYLEADLPGDSKEATLHFYNKSPDDTIQKFALKMNDAGAVDTVKGLQARLNNLGFDAGPVDGIMGRKTKSATREFQTVHNLMVDGISGPQTQNKLLAEHKS